MNVRTLRSEALLLLASAIWGVAFVAQREGMEHVGPLTFNAVRFALGAASLLPFFFRARRAPGGAAQPWSSGRTLLLTAGVLGLLLFAGATLQQAGLVHTTAGKAAFITGLYVILVPLLGLFVRHRIGRWVWIGALSAAVGLYLLSVTERFEIGLGDALVLAGAFFWALHVLWLGWLVRRMAPVRIAVLQFVACSLLSFIAALFLEDISWPALRAAMLPLLYSSFLSVGVAYTLQVVGQRGTPPAHAAILLSMETAFGALAGWWLLGETLSARGLAGCALMLFGVVLAQLSPGADVLPDPVVADHAYPEEVEPTGP